MLVGGPGPQLWLWSGGCPPPWSRSGGQGADFDQVVGEDSVPGPDPGSVGTVDAGAVPSVAAFEGADPSFDTGAPFHRCSECSLVFLGLSDLAGSARAGTHHGPHAAVVQ